MRTPNTSDQLKTTGGHSKLLVSPEAARIRSQPASNSKDNHNSEAR